MAKSFINRVSPSRSRTKVIDWPFRVDGEAPKVRMSVLGADKLVAANLATVDHFAALKKEKKIAHSVTQTDPAFDVQERVEMIFRAYEVQEDDGKWVPIADSAAELALESQGVINALYQEWSVFQSDVTAVPMTSEQMAQYIDDLKKNTNWKQKPAKRLKTPKKASRSTSTSPQRSGRRLSGTARTRLRRRERCFPPSLQETPRDHRSGPKRRPAHGMGRRRL
jgi:hypothetical protein